MNRTIKRILAVLLFILTVLIVQGMAAADTTVNVSVEVTYEYDMARAVHQMVNAFRHEDGVWYWNEDDKSKTVLSNLSDMEYDYGLEETAMKRAAECAIHYSHTRPNGEQCFTLYPQGARAENIAAGYRSSQAVFNGWREEEKNYSGQGHRRNMLDSGITRIGIGCVKANGIYFWAQCFGARATGQSEVRLTSTYTVEASMDLLINAGLTDASAAGDSVTLSEGGTAGLPAIKAYTNNGYFGVPITLLDPPWTDQGSLLEISGTTATGKAPGKTTIVWTAGANSVKVPVRVACRNHRYGELTVVKESTCTIQGTGKAECAVCGDIRNSTIPINPEAHTWGEPATTRAATCSASGVATARCKDCGKTKETAIPIDPGAHTWGTAVYTWSEDNLSATGTVTCVHNAGHTETETVKATGKVTVAPTLNSTGTMTYTSGAFTKPMFSVQMKTAEMEKLVLPVGPHTVSDGTRYEITDQGTAIYTAPPAGKSTVTVPDTVTVNSIELPVTKIADRAFSKNKKLKKVTIGANVLSIGASAFEGCGKLTAVKGGKGIAEIGAKAFKGCKALKAFTLYGNVAKIGKSAFEGCIRLKSLVIKTKKLTKGGVGKNCVKNIAPDAVIKCPSKQLKNYKKWFGKSGKAPKETRFRK